ncbi:MAG: Alanine--tRNA ligase [Ignavibacteria bacterium]|nr:Alanine--tRNA ligase [Ignavibacteria bacterium]
MIKRILHNYKLKALNSKEIRQSFLDFFREKDHKIVPSSSVVPFNDPTLLFTNAGMNQFKDVFLGAGTREYKRAADTQKCIRAGGKHNDLEEVGMDGFHHTFFEMLGNWSFGDYYKKEAIVWAWELLTDRWKLPKNKLWVTVFETDEESFEIWEKETDIDKSHILRFGEKDNFWEMGETGPCGPCSEIHFDFTEKGCRPEDINAGLEQVIEIWNLVFIQYNRKTDGELELLPKKHVDTGMGFERIVRVLQNKKSNYDTDIFSPIISEICRITGRKYEKENVPPISAIADHIRALTFAISDGAIPSNEGRGYVLRRILRRASRLARKLDYHKPVLFELVDTVADNFSYIFPELNEKRKFAGEVIKAEEESFNETLDRGIKLFNEVASSLKGTKIFPGEQAFKLYDTYGFPLDLTEVMARENGLKVDLLKFDEEMEKQKERAKSARKSETLETAKEADEFIHNLDTKYNPYKVDESGINTIAYIPENKKNIIVLSENPFYSESGGQISDTGILLTGQGQEIKVTDSKKNFIIVDRSDVFKDSQTNVKAVIDVERRKAIERNHSATHLLHEALRRVLGSHVKQLGSLVHNEYLRFDFPHFHKTDDKQLNEIEEMVNSKIKENIDVYTDEDISIEKANRIPNVKKFFGEKYGDRVRVVHIDDNFSIEFCGGTHVKNTSDIGLFKITKEESIASGTRRVFARTGRGILDYLNEKIREADTFVNELPDKFTTMQRQKLTEISGLIAGADYRNAMLLKKFLNDRDAVFESIVELKEKYLSEKKETEKQMMKENLSKVFETIDEFVKNSFKENGFEIVSKKIELNSIEEFKETGEHLRKKLKNGIGLLAYVSGEKINLVCTVSDNLVKDKNLNAGKIISVISKELGGGGGGRPNLATAGAKDIAKLDEILKGFPLRIKNMISN